MSHAKTVEMKILKIQDPSFEHIAIHLSKVVKYIFDIADDLDPMMAQKAFEYIAIMNKMADAILRGDEEALTEQVALMELKPGC